ncbi:hypothetical protein IMZ48_09435 [Candidatus Bathyarchaeota archaeon]|nr:hypothetical protein [Candidatus Bathyarchaeota archaeon]
MLRTRSAILMIYRPGPGPAAAITPLNAPLATRPLSTTTRATMPDMTSQEAAKDFIQFVNDSPTRASQCPFSHLPHLALYSD